MTDQDKTLFEQAMQGVKPLTATKRVVEKKSPPKPRRTQQLNIAEPEDQITLYDDQTLSSVTGGESLFFNRTGLQIKTIRKLKRGNMPVETKLDLHRKTIEQARQATERFIQNACDHGLRCILIVHGKGYGAKDDLPKIKNHLNGWLRQLPKVLAFCSAQPRDGGTGAVYVLLKR